MTKLLNWINEFDRKLDIPNWLVYVLLAVFILRIPSFFEPFYYGDEMIYLTLGNGIRQGLTLYKDLHDNKPPLIYILAAIAGSLFWFKVILAFWNLVTIVLFAKLVKVLFPKKDKVLKVATWAFAILTTIPLLEGNIVNSELFMIGFSIAALLILLKKDSTFKNIFFAGTLFSLGALFKIPAAFDVPVIVVYWLFGINSKMDFWIVIKRTIYLSLGFALPILLTLGWYAYKGAFHEYLIAAFAQNVGYLSSFRPTDVVKPFWVRNFPLLLRAFLVLLGVVILYFRKNKLTTAFKVAALWLLFSLFAVTLSERPYPHYLVQSVPAISIFVAMLLAEINVEQTLAVIPLTIALFVPFYYKFYYYNSFSYYENFLKFASHYESKQLYFSSFSPYVERDYQIASFLASSSTTNERIFVWEDSPTIYALSRRLPPIKYVAGYHINDFSSKKTVAEELSSSLPSEIVLLKNASPFPEINSLLSKNYEQVSIVSEASVFRLKAKKF